IPLVPLAARQLPLVFSGALVTETIFTWPGMGRLLVDSIGYRDYPVLMGILVFTAALVILGNLVADLVYAAIDPRVRHSGARPSSQPRLPRRPPRRRVSPASS